MLQKQQGQSLLELVVAIGIFVVVASSLAFLIFNSYVAGYLALEITQANFLAEEGLEATRSIRDNSWDDLAEDSYSLDRSSGNWTLQPPGLEDISDQLGGGAERVIIIEDLDLYRKKVTSKITWQFTETRPQEVSLVTYLTNWAGPTLPYLAQLHYRWRNDDGGE